MKRLLLLGNVFVIVYFSEAQKNKGFFVSYTYHQSSVMSSLPDSTKNKKIEIKVEHKTDSILTSTDTLESTLAEILTSFDLTLPFYIIANDDSSKTFFEGQEVKGPKVGIRASANTPDTIFYKKGTWRNFGSDEAIIIQSVQANETRESKYILGYKCIKFVASDKEGGDIIFWASEDMPNTLLPFTGLEKFKYGILEIDHLKNKWHTKATEIRKL